MKLASPHDIPADELDELSRLARSKNEKNKVQLATSPLAHSNGRGVGDEGGAWRFIGFNSSQPIDWHRHELSCSDCHREHQGSKHDLQAISSGRCQACHQNQFQSFASDHPEFTDFPRVTSPAIAFDHRRHQDLHFGKSKATFDCRACHVNESEQGRVGQVFRSVDFDKACASCHRQSLEASLPAGLIVFQLPSIDKQALERTGLNIGNWPSEASQLFDGRIPTFMQLLLRSNDDAEKVWNALPTSGNLADINLTDVLQQKGIVELANESRRLLDELASEGQEALKRRLTAGNHIDENANRMIEELLRGVPPDLFRQAYRDWFESSSSQPTKTEAFVSSTNTTKEADKDLLATSVSDDDLLSGEPSKTNVDQNDLLTDAIPDALAEARNIASLPAQPDFKIETQNAEWKELRSQKHLPKGGWLIDRQRMAIVYVPTGHADPWLTNFLSLGRDQMAASSEEPNALRWLEQFKSECLQATSLGRCAECHSPLGDLSVKKRGTELWRAKRFDARVRELTRFNHGPHLIQPGLSDCRSCHRMNEMSTIEQTSPVTHEGLIRSASWSSAAPPVAKHGDFLSIVRSDCASCHRPNAAGDSCTQCHNYHTHSGD
jgi:hypothetical protein